MIFAKYEEPHTGKHGVMFVLEPGNLEKLRMGKPIVKDVDGLEISILFSPDVAWITRQCQNGMDLPEAIIKSQDRPEVYLRDHHEEVKLR